MGYREIRRRFDGVAEGMAVVEDIARPQVELVLFDEAVVLAVEFEENLAGPDIDDVSLEAVAGLELVHINGFSGRWRRGSSHQSLEVGIAHADVILAVIHLIGELTTFCCHYDSCCLVFRGPSTDQ